MNYKDKNLKILKILKKNRVFSDVLPNAFENAFYGLLKTFIKSKHKHTFGKILYDNFCDFLQKGEEDETEKIIIEKIYEDNKDFVNENPTDTYIRLRKKYGVI